MYKSSTRTFQDLVNISGWTESDGPYPGVFTKRTPGEHCIWSRNWIDDEGALYPANTAPRDLDGLYYEFIDLKERGYQEAREIAERIKSEGEGVRDYAMWFLERARQNYGDFCRFPYTARNPGMAVNAVRDSWGGTT